MKVNITKFEQRLDLHSVVIFNPGMWAELKQIIIKNLKRLTGNKKILCENVIFGNEPEFNLL